MKYPLIINNTKYATLKAVCEEYDISYSELLKYCKDYNENVLNALTRFIPNSYVSIFGEIIVEEN